MFRGLSPTQQSRKRKSPTTAKKGPGWGFFAFLLSSGGHEHGRIFTLDMILQYLDRPSCICLARSKDIREYLFVTLRPHEGLTRSKRSIRDRTLHPETFAVKRVKWASFLHRHHKPSLKFRVNVLGLVVIDDSS